ARVLYRNEDTGGVDVVIAPDDPNTVYAVLWQARQGPWENAEFTGPESAIYKSTDGGDSWRTIVTGLPTFADGLGRIGITVAPSDPRRMYATVEVRGTGWVYRSDDAGESWTKASDDTRAASRPSDFAEIKVDPRNPDIVYSGSVVAWKSVDGGRTWSAFKGAPGGDDYHRIWINQENPDIILLAADQGAVITVNGGESWSSWYNQPTAQLYHVTADNSFPYRVCGGQQESGSVCIQSRGDYGAITEREWTPVGVEEYGYVAPDPKNPDIVYGGKVSRWDRLTRQVQNVAPRPFRSADYRVVRTAPVVFSMVDSTTLYFASNTLWKTTNGGQQWTEMSPDLTRRDSILPASVGVYASAPQAAGRHPGVIYTIAPSYITTNVVWTGSDDGLIHVTMDGGRTWKDVTPPALRDRPWSKISLMDAGHFDSLTAYAAVNTIRLDDLRPHIWRTHDGGKTWTEIVTGIDSGATINVVREDPVRRGLLYAGSETQTWFSIDDGEHWQSLRLNMPATSIRDLVIKDDDVVVGTHGRSFWILDDVTPLRQLDATTAARGVALFRPQTATRWRWNSWTDTPIPVDEPRGENPPDGALVNYWLKDGARSVTLEIMNAQGQLVRRYTSADTSMAPADIGNVPALWIRPTKVIAATPGMHRFVWDMRYAPPSGIAPSYPISAIPANTPRNPRGPLVTPGSYTVRLTVDGQATTQPLTVRMDPRVRATPAVLAHLLERSLAVRAALDSTDAALRDIAERRAAIATARSGAAAARLATLDSLDRRLAALAGSAGGRGAPAGGPETLARGQGQLATLYNLLQEADVAPTTQLEEAITERLRAQDALLAQWRQLSSR
ncbi:MAG: WD40/YVTN/BNR-like repeat-containing protein, partial [Gemmatimonadaceae bacterium]